MLFNSIEFLFLFLPVALLTTYIVRVRSWPEFHLTALALLSLGFIAVNGLLDVATLLASAIGNFFFVRAICTTPRTERRKGLLITGLAFNLVLLAFFKYFGTIYGGAADADAGRFSLQNLALPLGISFYTFQQIAYMVDAFRGLAPSHSFRNHLLFVSFFPQLIAGPIVHHAEMMPQLLRQPWRHIDIQTLTTGVALIVIGLFKKVVIADNLAPIVDRGFACATGGQVPTIAVSWISSAGFGLQIYFDFSAYSDIAIGLALLLGISLPFNFNSPFKARNIVEFWRRWHMTLSRFLRDYLYIPLGGNRGGESRRTANILVTMLLGGLWHGSGITFLAWGGLHGLFIVCVHIFDRYVARGGSASGTITSAFGAGLAWALTHICLIVSWVLFRAEDFEAARSLYQGMAGQGRTLTAASNCNWYIYESFEYQLGLIAVFGLIYAGILFVPNSQELAQRLRGLSRPWAMAGGVAASLMFLLCVYLISTREYEEFIYFVF